MESSKRINYFYCAVPKVSIYKCDWKNKEKNSKAPAVDISTRWIAYNEAE